MQKYSPPFPQFLTMQLQTSTYFGGFYIGIIYNYINLPSCLMLSYVFPHDCPLFSFIHLLLNSDWLICLQHSKVPPQHYAATMLQNEHYVLSDAHCWFSTTCVLNTKCQKSVWISSEQGTFCYMFAAFMILFLLLSNMDQICEDNST